MKRLSIFLIPILFLAITASAETIRRNETVYVELNSRGTPQTTTVVTWLKTDSHSPSIDHSRVKDVVNIKGQEVPEISKNRIYFSDRERHIFYSGSIDQPLPLAFSIAYQINGESVSAEELCGKRGRFTVTIDIENRTAIKKHISYTPLGTKIPKKVEENLQVPFVVMIDLGLSLREYNNVEISNGVMAVVGETFKCKWIALPWPKTRITMSADSENIALPAFLITASPKMIPLPEELSQIKPQLEKVYDGLDQLSHYLAELQGGAAMVADGNRLVYDNMSDLTEQYAQVVKGLEAQAKLVSSARQINRTIKKKISKGEWLPVIDKMAAALDVENQLLSLLLEGGDFSEEVLNFIEEHGGKKPPLDHFPADITRLRKKFEEVRAEIIKEKLPQLKKLRDGSLKVPEAAGKIRLEGVEEIRRQIAQKTDPLLRKLASLRIAEEMASNYDRFAGIRGKEVDKPPSAVQFVIKTPGSMVP